MKVRYGITPEEYDAARDEIAREEMEYTAWKLTEPQPFLYWLERRDDNPTEWRERYDRDRAAWLAKMPEHLKANDGTELP